MTGSWLYGHLYQLRLALCLCLLLPCLLQGRLGRGSWRVPILPCPLGRGLRLSLRLLMLLRMLCLLRLLWGVTGWHTTSTDLLLLRLLLTRCLSSRTGLLTVTWTPAVLLSSTHRLLQWSLSLCCCCIGCSEIKGHFLGLFGRLLYV